MILDHVTVIGNDNTQPSVKVSNTPSLTLKNNTSISGLEEDWNLIAAEITQLTIAIFPTTQEMVLAFMKLMVCITI